MKTLFCLIALLSVAATARATVFTVNCGDNLQTAANSAAYGDTINVQKGCGYGTLTLPSKTGTPADIVIQSTGIASLPTGRRVGPTDAAQLFTLTTNSIYNYALQNSAGAQHWKIIGAEITAADTAAVYPGAAHWAGDYLFIDRCWLHGLDTSYITHLKYGIYLEGSHLTVQDSTVSYFPQCEAPCPNSGYTSAFVALLMGDGDGLTLENSLFGADFANFLFGGSSFSTPNSATISGSPTFSGGVLTATLSNVGNLSVGDLMSFKEEDSITVNDANTNGTTVTSATAGFTVADVGLFKLDFPALGFGQIQVTAYVSPTQVTVATNLGVNSNTQMFKPGRYGSVQVDTINTGTKVITAHPVGANSDLRIVPMVPGDVQWNGNLPRNIIARHNTFWIDPVIHAAEQAAIGASVKGFWESKSMQTGLFEGNEFIGYPANVSWFPVNQGTPNGCPSVWSRNWDITVRGNWYHTETNSYQVFAFLGNSDYYCTNSGGKNYSFTQNLVQTGATLAYVDGDVGLTMDHNTATLESGSFAIDNFGGSVSGFVFTNNVLRRNYYGLHCQAGGGASSMGCYPSYTLSNNVFYDPDTGQQYCNNPYDVTNHCVNTIGLVGFVNSATDFALANGSTYKGTGTGGTDPGVDCATLKSYLTGNSGVNIATVPCAPSAGAGGSTVSGQVVISGRVIR